MRKEKGWGGEGDNCKLFPHFH